MISHYLFLSLEPIKTDDKHARNPYQRNFKHQALLMGQLCTGSAFDSGILERLELGPYLRAVAKWGKNQSFGDYQDPDRWTCIIDR